MTQIRHRLAVTAIISVALSLTACGTDTDQRSQDETAQASDSEPTSSPTTSADGGSRDGRLGVPPGGDYVLADTVEEWLTGLGKRRTQIFSGKVVGVGVGPALTYRFTGDLSVMNTALVRVKVGEVFWGTASPGEIVPVILSAGSGGTIDQGDPVPLTNQHGTSIEAFESEFPDGTPAVVMYKSRRVTQFMGLGAQSAVYPDGLPERLSYIQGIHPQGFSVRGEEGDMSGWGRMSYEEMIEALRAST